MYLEVDWSMFVDEFSKLNRKENFSYEGLRALYDYLLDLEDNICGEDTPGIQFDVIALCCDFTEYRNIKEIQKNYPNIKDLEDLKNNTLVIEFDSGVIIQNF